jgi:hypothetical protein
MCHVSAGKQESQMNSMCGCGCNCPVVLPADEEIRNLEEHRKILQDRLGIIDKKIAGLKNVKEQ